VDLNPAGYTFSTATGVSDGRQVGWGYGPATGGNSHALLWSGSASSAVDLNPSGLTGSWLYATAGGQQVGYGYGPATGNGDHAFVWSGTADSAVDLKNFLSPDYGFCYARGIDENGNIIGLANYTPTGQLHAILWTPVPEPPASLLLAFGAAAWLLSNRLRHRS
jgi:hypothetical protein